MKGGNEARAMSLECVKLKIRIYYNNKYCNSDPSLLFLF